MIPVFVICFIAFVIWKIFRQGNAIDKTRKELEAAAASVTESPKAIEARNTVPDSAQPDAAAPNPEVVEEQMIEPDRMAALDLAQGTATLIVRQRKRTSSCVGYLLIWLGKKKPRSALDSMYALGEIESLKVSEEVIQKFITLATARMTELKEAGKRKRRAGADQSVEATTLPLAGAPQPSTVVPEVQAAVASIASIVSAPPLSESVPEASASQPDENPAVKTKRKFPSIYRGTILEKGFANNTSGGATFRTYRVKLRGDDGIVEEVFGAHLKTACEDAGVDVGDVCEVIKVGKRASEDKRKAPMTLFQITRLHAASAGGVSSHAAS